MKDITRKLASIQIIEEKKPIQGMDRIEAIRVLGWWLIAKKDEFEVGDKCVYFEIDSFLPEKPEYEFLRKSSFKHHLNGQTGFRLKTIKLHGQISQGLALPLNGSRALKNTYEVGRDMTDELGVIKWEDNEHEIYSKQKANNGLTPFPHFIPKTDEIRIHSYIQLLDELNGKEYYITVKLDGSSMTVYRKNDKFGVCARNIELTDEDIDDSFKSSYLYAANQYDLKNKLNTLGKNIAIQGELCGPSNGNPKNPLKLSKHDFFVFNIYDIDQRRYYTFDEMIETCKILDLKTVPLLERGDKFKYDLYRIQKLAIGKYDSGSEREGIVVRSIDKTISFKVISEEFLLKQKN